MRDFNFFLLICTALSLCCAVAAIAISRRKTRRMLLRIEGMLEDAIEGAFQEKTFDESLLSSVESKLMHYLSASAVTANHRSEERDRIKQLIGDISHQTKTPVSNILLYAQLLGEQPLSDEGACCVRALNAQAEKLNLLIDALVKISRLETGVLALHPKTAEVGPMLNAVLDQVLPKARAKDMALCCKPVAGSACFDPKWTAEALYNIVDNAVKYAPAGSAIQIETTAYQLFFRIDISDSGIGIAAEEQANIFARFYRSPAVSGTEGVGIGLYLARQMIAGQGGYIKVRSAPDAGTTFSVFLPLQA